jgi:hypothetical protein
MCCLGTPEDSGPSPKKAIFQRAKDYPTIYVLLKTCKFWMMTVYGVCSK